MAPLSISCLFVCYFILIIHSGQLNSLGHKVFLRKNKSEKIYLTKHTHIYQLKARSNGFNIASTCIQHSC